MTSMTKTIADARDERRRRRSEELHREQADEA